MEDREAVEQKMRSCEGKYQDIMAQVTSVLSVEDISMGSSVGELVAKVIMDATSITTTEVYELVKCVKKTSIGQYTASCIASAM